MKRHRITVFAGLLLVCLLAGGCGETLRGIGRDTKRIYRGTKTIFVSGK
jgi:predicted small secreted protein